MIHQLARITLAALAAVTVVSAFPAGAAAHGDKYPYHSLATSYCDDSPDRVRIYPPRSMASVLSTDFRNPKKVWWSADLLRYNRRKHKWRTVYSGAWYYGFASDYGLYQDPLTGATWHKKDGNTIIFLPVDIYRGGKYRIKHYMDWSWDEAGTHVQSGGTCPY
jgi:hypothetical protein